MGDDEIGAFDDSMLRTNAWCGEPANATRDNAYSQWGTTGKRDAPGQSLAPIKLDLANWRDKRVGWGVVLPDNDTPNADKAQALDAPECIRELLAKRNNAPVFRYRSELPPDKLRWYAPGGAASDPSVRGPRGTGANEVPRYLLIVGGPDRIPWSFQYRLQENAYVGRLDLDDDALGHYVNALLSDWNGSAVQHTKPLVWATDHGVDDITRLMRRTVAERLALAFTNDAGQEFDMKGGYVWGAGGTTTALIDAIEQRRPAFIATSSHGATFPLDHTDTLAAQLGIPVDRDHTPVALSSFKTNWPTHGAVWYAHACCSAGCEKESAFKAVAASTSKLGETLAALELVGAVTAPLPKALLGSAKPARAFVGHVEPTFDWTLRDQLNGQTTTAHIIEAFYTHLHDADRPPIGLAMRAYYESIGGLWRDVETARGAVNKMKPGAAESLKRLRLIASDLESMVLLGDPTVSVG